MIAPEACGRVVQINVSRGGIPKYAIAQGSAGPLGLEGDAVAHPQIHGGPVQALLLIASEAVDALAARGYPVFYGALGENITTAGIDPRSWRAGQQYRVGAAEIELTKPRAPCATLDVYGQDRDGVKIQQAIYDSAVRRGDPSSAFWGMSGFYARVLRPGAILAGDPIVLLSDVA
jgi:MOSC domain-containing protein YiiM